MQCFHCGREVSGTVHTQNSYRVDYYRLHTGRGEWDHFVNPKPDTPPIRYLRLTQSVDVLTCVQCYERQEIRQRLADDFAGRRSILEPTGEAIDSKEQHSKG